MPKWLEAYATRGDINRLEDKLDKLANLINLIITSERHMSAELDALSAEVARNTSIEQSAVSLIQGLAAQITAAGTDPLALAQLTNDLSVSADALAAAIAANTPAAPAAPAP